MCQPDYPHPSIETEKMFHDRNANIVDIQNRLTNGCHLPFSAINELVSNIRYMRMKNEAFNIRYGLCKEIA